MLIPVIPIFSLQSIETRERERERERGPIPHQIWPKYGAQLQNFTWETIGITPNLDLELD
jgi:hypothetical protein